MPVSGKTVFRGMGIEGAEVAAWPLKPGAAGPVDRTRSGYHGSFLLHLPPGAYRLEARAVVPRGRDDQVLRGRLEPVAVPADARRVDRLVVELAPAP